MSIFPCPCTSINEYPIGNCSVGGSALVSGTSIGGGSVLGGRAIVSTSQSSDGYRAFSLIGDFEGVACLDASMFDGDAAVTATDPFHDSPLSVSVWVKLTTPFKERPFYERGGLWFGVGFLGHLQVRISTSEDTYFCWSSEPVPFDRWHHVAMTLDSTVTIFLNGIAVGSTEIAGSIVESEVPLIGSGFFGLLQELRVYPEIKTADWWIAERENVCSSGFFLT